MEHFNNQHLGMEVSLLTTFRFFVNVNSFTNAGGEGVYIAESFQYKKLTLEPHFDGCEQLWLRISNTTTSINYVIGTIYRHPSSNTKDFIEFLMTFFLN